jgi:CreA protein
MRLVTLAAALFAAAPLAAPATAEEVGKVGVDWVGNDIVIEAIADPKVQGVTCHVAYFDRGLIDRLSKGNWFEDPFNARSRAAGPGPSCWAPSIGAKAARRCSASGGQSC